MFNLLVTSILSLSVNAASVKTSNHQTIAVQCLKNADVGSAGDIICWNHSPKVINEKFKAHLSARPNLFYKKASSRPALLQKATEGRPPGFHGAVYAKRDYFECYELEFASGEKAVRCDSLNQFNTADSPEAVTPDSQEPVVANSQSQTPMAQSPSTQSPTSSQQPSNGKSPYSTATPHDTATHQPTATR